MPQPYIKQNGSVTKILNSLKLHFKKFCNTRAVGDSGILITYLNSTLINTRDTQIRFSVAKRMVTGAVILIFVHSSMSIPVAARSKVLVCGSLLVGIAGSNPARKWLSLLSVGCDQTSLQQADDSSGGLLPSVVCIAECYLETLTVRMSRPWGKLKTRQWGSH